MSNKWTLKPLVYEECQGLQLESLIIPLEYTRPVLFHAQDDVLMELREVAVP
jgi:hypothetical protein